MIGPKAFNVPQRLFVEGPVRLDAGREPIWGDVRRQEEARLAGDGQGNMHKEKTRKKSAAIANRKARILQEVGSVVLS